MEVNNTNELLTYQKHYNENSLWKKLAKVAGRLGKKTTYHVLVLYYVLISPNVSIGNKSIICGALGYLILPIDLIPDFILGLGFVDDAAAILAAFKAIQACVTPEIEAKAFAKLKDWFGEN